MNVSTERPGESKGALDCPPRSALGETLRSALGETLRGQGRGKELECPPRSALGELLSSLTDPRGHVFLASLLCV